MNHPGAPLILYKNMFDKGGWEIVYSIGNVFPSILFSDPNPNKKEVREGIWEH
jgi:hypothetical protein